MYAGIDDWLMRRGIKRLRVVSLFVVNQVLGVIRRGLEKGEARIKQLQSRNRQSARVISLDGGDSQLRQLVKEKKRQAATPKRRAAAKKSSFQD